MIYRVGILVEPDNLNPFIGYMFSSYEIWYLTYEPLVGYDYGKLTPVKGEHSPGLATDWSMSPDGKTWTFTIRRDATWSDGVPVTAQDVAFTYNYIVRNNLTNWTTYTQNIVRAVATNAYTVKIYCSQPKADMLSAYVPVVPQHIWSRVPGNVAGLSYSNDPPIVGDGPFTCTTFKKGGYVELVANPRYWLGRPAIDQLYFEYYTNEDTMAEDLRAGHLDGATGLVDAQYRELRKQPGIEARVIRANGFDELAFNCYDGSQSRGNPVLRDARFRQALNYAIDKQRICTIAYGGHATPATTVITAGYYHDPDWHWEPPTGEKYTYDPAKAEQLLDAAGYRDTNGDGYRDYKGKPITLRLYCREGSTTYQTTERLIAGWLERIGIKVVPSVMDEGAMSNAIYNRSGGKLAPNYDMFIWGWYSDLDPGSILSYFTTAQVGAESDCGYSNPQYDQLFQQQSHTIDPAVRKTIIDQMQQTLYRDSPYIVLAYSCDMEAFNTAKWQGYAASPAGVGNVLFPPYGNAGSQNYLLIRPRAATTQAAHGSSGGVIVLAVAAAVAVALVVLVVVRRRRPQAVEE